MCIFHRILTIIVHYFPVRYSRIVLSNETHSIFCAESVLFLVLKALAIIDICCLLGIYAAKKSQKSADVVYTAAAAWKPSLAFPVMSIVCKSVQLSAFRYSCL